MRRYGPWSPERMRAAVDRSAALLLQELDQFWTARAAALGCSVAQAQAEFRAGAWSHHTPHYDHNNPWSAE